MYTDYKFWFIRRDDDGFITEAAVRYFEGDYQQIDDGEGGTKVQYIRTKRLGKAEITHVPKGQFKKDLAGNEVVFYYPSDFGSIKTDDELRTFLNGELKKDHSRTPIPEQA